MPDVPDRDLTEMRNILRACATEFRRFERDERVKASGSGGQSSIVETRLAELNANRYVAFAEACEKYAARDTQ